MVVAGERFDLAVVLGAAKNSEVGTGRVVGARSENKNKKTESMRYALGSQAMMS